MARITFEDKIALEEQGAIAEVNKITADNINEIKTAINSLENDFLPLTGGTLRGDLSFNHTSASNDGHITWAQGTYWQRLKVVDSSSNTATLFAFQRSSDGGETFNNIATLSNDGIFTATKLSGEVVTTKITGSTVTFSGAVKVTSGLTASTVNGYSLGNASSKTIRGLSSTSHSSWANLDTDSKYVPDMTFIAYWNGAYNSSGNSNLQYCDRGRFGTMVTKGSGDYISTAGGTLSSGSIKKAGGSYNWNTIRESNETAPISITSYTGYQPAIKQKTPSGVYGIGCYTNNVHITYFTDASTDNNPVNLLTMNYNGNGISAGGVNIPHVWVQSGTPSAKQTGDIWFS